jgi:hypothetical protein
VRRITTAERMPPLTMSISGMTPSKSGDTGPPVVGRADAEAVALAVELAVAVALVLADELLLAHALDIALGLDVAQADALGLIIAEADALGLDIALAEDEADALGLIIAEADALGLDIALAEDEALDIMLLSPIIMLSSPICCAIAAAAKTNTATMHRAANKRNFLKMPPSVVFPRREVPAPFPGGKHNRQTSEPRSMYVSRPCVVESPTVTLVNRWLRVR